MTDSTVGISAAKASASIPKGFASIDWGDSEECPVCRKLLGSRDVGVPNCCNHFFCFTCIKSWVTKSKSNCPMDRLDITELRVFDTRGKFLRTEQVEAKEEDHEEVDFLFDDDGICPDCGWFGMRATVGVCLHCMYHVESPFPVRSCPQCMEDESNPSDEEWVPDSARESTAEARRRTLRSDNNQHVLLDDEDATYSFTMRRARNTLNLSGFIVDDNEDESDGSVNLEGHTSDNESVVDLAQPGPSTSRAPPRPIRKKIPTKKRKATTKKRKVKRKRVVRKKTTASGGKTRRKRKVKRRRTVKSKRRAASNRPRLPEDSAKKRLAKILGVKAPKYNGQMLPRGCKKKPVTAAQRQAFASTSSSTVYNRPVESLDYHNSSVPTLHLFGGPELEYFPSDSDSEGSSLDYSSSRKPLPSTSASVIKRYKNNALKSLRKKAVAAPVPASTTNILDSILESQNKKFEIKSGLEKRLDPYSEPSISSINSKTLRSNLNDEASCSSSSGRSRASRRSVKFSKVDAGSVAKIINCKKSPSKDDDLDLYGDIPAEGTGNAGADEDDVGEEDDYLFGGSGDGGSNNGGDDGRDDDDDDKKDIENSNEEEQEKEDDEDEEDDDETEEISEMVIDESIMAQEDEPKDAEDETKDPLAIVEAPEKALPLPADTLSEPEEEEKVTEVEENVIVPDIVPETVFPLISPIVVASHVLAPPVFRYSETSMQIARHLTLDEEVLPNEQSEPEEHPEEPESDPEEKSEEINNQMSPPQDLKPAKIEISSPPRSEKEASPVLEPPKAMMNGLDSDNAKKGLRSKSRKRSLVEELFGSDIEDSAPPRKISTDKGSEDGEIKDKKRKSVDEEVKQQTKKENHIETESSARMSPKRNKRKKDKSRDGSGKKKKKERKRSRSRSSSSDKRKKHHSRKHSPSRHSRKRSRSRSRSRKRHEENGRLSVHERLGPKRGRSRDRSAEAPGKKEVFSSGENILVSVNFSRRRKRIAEIAAKRRPVAVINLAVDEDKSPIVEKGDSPKEVIELDEAWSSDDEPVKAKPKETPTKQKDKSLKSKETGPKTPPEPQVKFSIASRPQLKLKNVLGVHDDDDDEVDQGAELKEAAKPLVGETYDPFNPTASPIQEAENEPPAAAPSKISSVPPEGAAPQQRPLSPPKLMTEMPKIERPPAVAPVAAAITKPPPVEIFPGLPANVANILCSSQLQNVFNPQLTALTVPLLLSNPCFLNMQNVVQQSNQQPQSAAPSHPKADNGVVDMDLESPYSPAASEGDDLFEPPAKTQTTNKPQEKFDTIFASTNKRAVKTTKAAVTPSSSKTPVKEIKTAIVTAAGGKKDISIKMDRNNLKVVGELPSSAAETQVKEKFLKKLNRQERVVEEVKVALKPHYTKKLINKEEYKDILRRAVPKVCHNKSGEINPAKIKSLVTEYVKRVRHERKKAKKA